MERKLAVIIMAAGKGTRMNNPEMAKVMYPVNGKPMVDYVVDLALQVGSSRTAVIVGWQRGSVIAHLAKTHPGIECVVQSPQLGTGHAVMQAEPLLAGFDGDVLVLSGDVPLLRLETIRSFLAFHRSTGAAATVLTAELDDATGYGRIIRGEGGNVTAIVEEKDATGVERQIREINSGIYVFDVGPLFKALKHITPENAQKEYYLTDVFGYFWRNHLPVGAVKARRAAEIQGINTPQQLEASQEAMVKGDC